MIRKKRITVILCVLVIAVYVSYHILANSKTYLDWKTQQRKQAIVNLFLRDEETLRELATSIYFEAQNHTDGLYRDSYRSNYPKELDTAVVNYLNANPIKLDTVYVGGQTQFIYPERCCVFRHTIGFNRGVYAWIDLVYAPYHDDTKQNWYRESECISEDWYIVILYGF